MADIFIDRPPQLQERSNILYQQPEAIPLVQIDKNRSWDVGQVGGQVLTRYFKGTEARASVAAISLLEVNLNALLLLLGTRQLV